MQLHNEKIDMVKIIYIFLEEIKPLLTLKQ